MVNAKSKGKAGELEFSKYLIKHGFDSRRGVQYKGTKDSPDVISELPFYIEVKRRERLNHLKALQKAKEDSKEEKPPIVAHRKNRGDWVIILYAEDFIDLLKQ